MQRCSTRLLKSGVLWALLFVVSGALPAARAYSSGNFNAKTGLGNDGGGLEASWMALYLKPSQLAIGTPALGFADPSSAFMSQWGGGLAINRGLMRLSLLGLSGVASSEKSGHFANWGLNSLLLIGEQRYPMGTWEMMGGFIGSLNQLSIDLRDGAYTHFDSTGFGGGLVTGARWPADTAMSFYTRAGYLWIPAGGQWHGAHAPQISKSFFDLNAAFTQVGVDIFF